jgi:hypothetical protein
MGNSLPESGNELPMTGTDLEHALIPLRPSRMAGKRALNPSIEFAGGGQIHGLRPDGWRLTAISSGITPQSTRPSHDRVACAAKERSLFRPAVLCNQ